MWKKRAISIIVSPLLTERGVNIFQQFYGRGGFENFFLEGWHDGGSILGGWRSTFLEMAIIYFTSRLYLAYSLLVD